MAKLLKADHTRRIELQGVGLAPRPVDIDQLQTGFQALKTLRIYRFDPPAVIEGHAEEDEVFIVLLKGEIELAMRSEHWSDSHQRFELKSVEAADAAQCAAYLPPHAEYVLKVRSAAEVAYARALPVDARPPALFRSKSQHRAGHHLLLDIASYAERLRLQLWQVATHADAKVLVLPNLPMQGETLVHVRTAPERSVSVNGAGLHSVALENWDTVAVSPGESPQMRIAPHASLLGLVVAAA